MSVETVSANSVRQQALELEALGFWVVPIYPAGAVVNGKTKTGKEPIGAAWGLDRRDESWLRGKFREHPGAGAGVCFGPGRGPGGAWPMDAEGDGPKAVDSLDTLLGGEQITTMGWSSTRGSHNIFSADGDRLLTALAAAGAVEGKGQKAGVWHLPELPDLEFRVGGVKADDSIKQLQSVIPPTPGTDGNPRRWTNPPSAGMAVLPESAYAVLGSIAESHRITAEAEALKAEARPVAAHTNNGHTNGDSFTMKAESAIGAYGRKALESEVDEFSRQSEGGRHAYLLGATLKLASLVKAGALTDSECLAALKDGARKNAMGEGRFHEIDEAWQSGYAMAGARNLADVGNRKRAAQRGSAQPVARGQSHSGRWSFANCETIPNSNGGFDHPPRSVVDMADYLKTRTGGWPKRVDEALFLETNTFEPIYLASAGQLFGYLDGVADVFWMRGPDLPTPERFYEFLRKFGAEKFKTIETAPHWPAMAGAYYMHPAINVTTSGGYFERFLDFFSPDTTIDRELIRAAIMTPFWGGSPGARPAFRIEGPENDLPELAGRGTGKSTFPIMLAMLTGGYIDLEEGEHFPDFKTRLLSNEEGRKRIVRVDNLKTLRLSWAPLEAFITSPVISGKALYKGEGQRPNTLTVFITVNGGGLSKDMAQRVVPIRLARPKYVAGWMESVASFIERHRWDLIGEIVATLAEDAGIMAAASRWSSWEKEVLTKCSDFDKCQTEIAKRVESIDSDDDDAFEIEGLFRRKLLDRKHNPDSQNIKIPTSDAAAWFSEHHGKKLDPSMATALLKTKPVKRLRYKRMTNERFWLWLKQDGDLGANPMDLYSY